MFAFLRSVLDCITQRLPSARMTLISVFKTLISAVSLIFHLSTAVRLGLFGAFLRNVETRVADFIAWTCFCDCWMWYLRYSNTLGEGAQRSVPLESSFCICYEMRFGLVSEPTCGLLLLISDLVLRLALNLCFCAGLRRNTIRREAFIKMAYCNCSVFRLAFGDRFSRFKECV